MPRKNTAEANRWKLVHNRRPGEQKDPLFYYELLSPDETAKVMGLTRQRVNQLERSALYKLRRGLREFWNEYYG